MKEEQIEELQSEKHRNMEDKITNIRDIQKEKAEFEKMKSAFNLRVATLENKRAELDTKTESLKQMVKEKVTEHKSIKTKVEELERRMGEGGRRVEVECPVCWEEMLPPKQVLQVKQNFNDDDDG